MKKTPQPENSMTRKALKALREAVAEVVEEHRREGRPLAEWKDGRAVLVSPGKAAVVRESPAKYRVRSRTYRPKKKGQDEQDLQDFRQ